MGIITHHLVISLRYQINRSWRLPSTMDFLPNKQIHLHMMLTDFTEVFSPSQLKASLTDAGVYHASCTHIRMCSPLISCMTVMKRTTFHQQQKVLDVASFVWYIKDDHKFFVIGRPLRGEISVPFSWVWAGYMTCIHQQNEVEWHWVPSEVGPDDICSFHHATWKTPRTQSPCKKTSTHSLNTMLWRSSS